MHSTISKYVVEYRNLTDGGHNLEVGSLDVNGSVRRDIAIDVGVDMRDGKGVDLVCSGEDLPQYFKQGEFDAVVSTDTLEHVKYWREFLQGIWHVLKDDGHFICTIAAKRKKRHAYPDDYWRLEEGHVKRIFENQEIVNINPDLGVSFGFIIKKKAPLIDLTNIKLDPVDDQVPGELL